MSMLFAFHGFVRLSLAEIIFAGEKVNKYSKKYDQRYHSGTHTCAVQSLNDRELGKLKRKQAMEERQEWRTIHFGLSNIVSICFCITQKIHGERAPSSGHMEEV